METNKNPCRTTATPTSHPKYVISRCTVGDSESCPKPPTPSPPSPSTSASRRSRRANPSPASPPRRSSRACAPSTSPTPSSSSSSASPPSTASPTGSPSPASSRTCSTNMSRTPSASAPPASSTSATPSTATSSASPPPPPPNPAPAPPPSTSSTTNKSAAPTRPPPTKSAPPPAASAATLSTSSAPPHSGMCRVRTADHCHPNDRLHVILCAACPLASPLVILSAACTHAQRRISNDEDAPKLHPHLGKEYGSTPTPHTMPPVKRTLLNILTLTSLLLSAATLILWIRSEYRSDSLLRTKWWTSESRAGHYRLFADSNDGLLTLGYFARSYPIDTKNWPFDH